MEDRSKRGRTVHGTRHHSAKLNDETAMELYNLKDTKSLTEVAKDYGITKQSVSKIWNKKSWTHIHAVDVQVVTIPVTPS
jgi:DNA invertase Pin-like site-specific DNA recombinase